MVFSCECLIVLLSIIQTIQKCKHNFPKNLIPYNQIPVRVFFSSFFLHVILSKRKYYFGKELFIDRADFVEQQVPKFFRFYPGNEVRLMGAYILKCESFEKDETGKVTTIYCTYDPETKSGSGCTRKVKGTIHWVNAKHAKLVECRLSENLIDEETAEEVEGQERATDGYKINPNSKQVLENCYVEDIDFDSNERYQFVRNGYFCLDSDSTEDKLVFNRTISLKETKKV
jgi:glutaminyl-tRNA synthetase